MKYYNFETAFTSLANKIVDFLKENKIYFELSKNGLYYHFEILTNEFWAACINNFLDQHIITEAK